MASKIVVVPPAPTLQSLQKELSQLKDLLLQKNSGPAQRAGSVVSFASQDNLLITESNNIRTVAGGPPTGKQPADNYPQEHGSVFDRRGPLGPSQMYPVPEKVLERLKDQSKYVDFNLLLPKNRVESAAPVT